MLRGAHSKKLSTAVYTAPGDPPPGQQHNETPCPVTYDATVTLTGYLTSPGALRPGNTLSVLTTWEVQAAHPEELVLFTHLLNAENSTITQMDRLDAPSWQWQVGDRFAQVHTLTLPDALLPGDYSLVIGFYTRVGMQRLPVDGVPGPVTRVLIPVEVLP